MKFCTFLLCSLLFTSYYVNSKPIQLEDGEFELAAKEIKEAEEFLGSFESKLKNIDSDEDEKNKVQQFFNYILEVIQLGPVSAIDIAERLSDIEDLIHQASDIQSGSDDLKEVLKKLEKFEAVVRKYKEYQKVDAVNSVKNRIEIVGYIKRLFNENPDNFPARVIENADEIGNKLLKSPRYLKYLIKNNLPKIFENLWISELAIESTKSVHPSEAEQLKTILREIEAKIFSLKRETKRVAMLTEINKNIITNDEYYENLIHARVDVLQNDAVDIVYRRDKIVNEDEQEELVDKIIASIPTLERVNSSFIDEAKFAVEAFKSEFPNDVENATKFDRYLERCERKFNDFVDSVKTLVEKIKLDTAEGVRTNPLYIDMFVRITELKFADMHLAEWAIFKGIENVIKPLIPLGEETRIDENRTSRKILFDQMGDGLKTLFNCTSHYRSHPGPLHEYLDSVRGEFTEFSPGLFPWLQDDLPGLYTRYLCVRV